MNCILNQKKMVRKHLIREQVSERTHQPDRSADPNHSPDPDRDHDPFGIPDPGGVPEPETMPDPSGIPNPHPIKEPDPMPEPIRNPNEIPGREIDGEEDDERRKKGAPHPDLSLDPKEEYPGPQEENEKSPDRELHTEFDEDLNPDDYPLEEPIDTPKGPL